MQEEIQQTKKVRALAKRQGLRLVKSRCRTPEAIGYGGCMLVSESDAVEFGGTPYLFCASLDEIEDYLNH